MDDTEVNYMIIFVDCKPKQSILEDSKHDANLRINSTLEQQQPTTERNQK